VTPESLFQVASTAVMPGWVLLAVAPRWKPTRILVRSGALSLLLAGLYLVLVLLYFPGAVGGFGSLAEVARLFESRPLLLAGWVHYLAFDLFVGAWETGDAETRGVSHLLVIPCLVLTFFFGPIGLLAYFAVRAVAARRAKAVA
jgi:Domain of unknown function (DUF4281)